MALVLMKYKLLVADIDGTLIGKDGAISAEDRDALAKVCRSGTPVSLSTGRVAQACSRIINQLSLDGYHIFCDGALVSNTKKGEEVYVKPISQELVRQIVEFAHLNEISLDLYSSTHFFVERETWLTDLRRQFFGISPTVVDFARLWQKERIIKGALVVSSAEERDKADNLRRQFKSRLSFSRTKTPAYPAIEFVNVVDLGVSKGKALEALTSHLGISLSEVIAIGDGSNDIPLLSIVGLAIAMGNAPDEVKTVADYVTLDVEHNGLAAAIEQFLL